MAGLSLFHVTDMEKIYVNDYVRGGNYRLTGLLE